MVTYFQQKKNSVALVRKRTIPTEPRENLMNVGRPPEEKKCCIKLKILFLTLRRKLLCVPV
jgi:hypothetical protein